MELNPNLSPTAQYTDFPGYWGGLVSERVSGASSYYGFDPQASARILVSVGGVITDSYTYKAFGEELAVSGSTPNPHRYIGLYGYYRDIATRLSVRARVLRVDLGRWISRDPIGFDGGDWNLYGFVSNNPATLLDPSGQQSIADCLRKKPKAFCFWCLYTIYVQNQPRKWNYCPKKACDLANRACNTKLDCGPCGPYDPKPYNPGGCHTKSIEQYAEWIRGLAKRGDACGGVDGADKLAHCWAACMIASCFAVPGMCLWKIRRWFDGEDDLEDIKAENAGLACAQELGETTYLKCLKCCADATYDMECY